MPETVSVSVGNPVPAKVLLAWQSPARVFVPKDEKYVRTVVLTLVAIGVVLVFLRQFLLYAVFLALAFVSYVLRSVPPEAVDHKITEHGLTSGHHSYLWKELKDFWFTVKGDFLILNIDTNLRFPPRLFLLLPKNDRNLAQAKFVEALSAHLPYRELPKENAVDRIFDRLSERFNLS